MKILKWHTYWFSIIEVLVGIFVFSLGLVSIYALLVSSLNINEYNRNGIIASNLSREQIELFRNIRDTNYKKLNVWNQINPETSYSSSNLFSTGATGSYYKLENDFSWGDFPTIVQDISTWFLTWESNLTTPSMQSYRLCISWDWIYTYVCTWGNTPTPFYKYVHVEQAIDDISWLLIPGAFKITSKVIWFKKWYHEYEIKTLITDWRRI